LKLFNFYLKHFFLSLIVLTIFTLKKKDFFQGRFSLLTCDSARIKKKPIFYFCLYFNIFKAHLNRWESLGCVPLFEFYWSSMLSRATNAVWDKYVWACIKMFLVNITKILFQSVLRSENLRCLHLVGSHKDTQCFGIWHRDTLLILPLK